jgi:hypothetical protein
MVVHKMRGVRQAWIQDEVETEALNGYIIQVKYYYALRLVPLSSYSTEPLMT